jgi:hypothetical protein
VIHWLKRHLGNSELDCLGDLLLLVDAADEDANLDLIELLRIFATSVDPEEKLGFLLTNAAEVAAILRPGRRDSLCRFILFFDAFSLPDYLGVLLDGPDCCGILEHAMRSNEDYPLRRVLADCGELRSDLLKLCWEMPHLVLQMPAIFGIVSQEPYRFGGNEIQLILDVFFSRPLQREVAAFVCAIPVQSFVYSDIIKQNLGQTVAFASAASDAEFALCESCARFSVEFAVDLAAQLKEKAMFANPKSPALNRALKVALCAEESEASSEIVSDIVVTFMDYFGELATPEPNPVLETLARFLEADALEPRLWEVLLISQLLEMTEVGSPSILKCLKVGVPKADEDNLRAPIEALAGAIQAPEKIGQFTAAVQILDVCFETRPRSRAWFDAVMTVDDELIRKWPPQLGVYRHVFAKK